jgi:hypothetical protein
MNYLQKHAVERINLLIMAMEQQIVIPYTLLHRVVVGIVVVLVVIMLPSGIRPHAQVIIPQEQLVQIIL